MGTVPGSWPGTQQASVCGGPHVGSAEERKTLLASHWMEYRGQEAG